MNKSITTTITPDTPGLYVIGFKPLGCSLKKIYTDKGPPKKKKREIRIHPGEILSDYRDDTPAGILALPIMSDAERLVYKNGT